jgi:hypothetical protein
MELKIGSVICYRFSGRKSTGVIVGKSRKKFYIEWKILNDQIVLFPDKPKTFSIGFLQNNVNVTKLFP